MVVKNNIPHFQAAERRHPDPLKLLPASTPSGPRAMKPEPAGNREPGAGRERYRDNAPPPPKEPPASAESGPSSQPDSGSRGSLRSRISATETLSFNGAGERERENQ